MLCELRIDNWIQFERKYKQYGFGLIQVEKQRSLLSVKLSERRVAIDFLWFHVICIYFNKPPTVSMKAHGD